MSRAARGLLTVAASLAGAFATCELLGLRDMTSVLSGTPAGAGDALGGLLYVLSWFGVVVAAPALVLAAVAYEVLRRAVPSASRSSASAAPSPSEPGRAAAAQPP